MSQYIDNWVNMYQLRIQGKELDLKRAICDHAKQVVHDSEINFSLPVRKTEYEIKKVRAQCRNVLDNAERTGQPIQRYQACLAEKARLEREESEQTRMYRDVAQRTVNALRAREVA